ncbi:hypothetical protein RYX36_023616, partial [Vicia faba]
MAEAEAAASASKRMAAAVAASASKRMAAEEKECCYLPDELLEYIFKSVNDDNLTFKSLSALSKQFLSITNRLRFSVTITDETIPFLPRLFLRFPNLTSLNLTLLSKTLEQVDEILTLISTFPLRIKSLNLSNDINTISIPIPANGLIALSKTITNLTSLTFYGMKYFDKKDLFFIAHYFPLLEEVNLINPRLISAGHFMIINDNDTLLLTLPNLRKIDLSGNIYFNGRFIQVLRKNCKLLQEIIIPPRPWTSR